ncbi:MAG TPA: ZIP family metal transporter [Vicinamibacterales bacterium]|nr:ZIP family metal transporter [Vicinamibacterales bacterium]
MRLLGIAIGLSILGSLGGIIVASSFLLLGETIRVRLVPWLISYAVGTLIGVALLALVPEALAELPARPAMLTMAAGILSFFLLEKAVIWRHCHHDEDCHVHSTAASLVIVGDVFHTFVDGAVIAAAVLTSVPLGLTTAIAVATHEIPQEVGDVAILLRAGYSRMRAFTLNVLAGIGGILGAAAMVLASKVVPQGLPYVLAFAAGNFLYVAMSDLIPDLHRGNSVGGVRQVLLIAAGIVTIAVL